MYVYVCIYVCICIYIYIYIYVCICVFCAIVLATISFDINLYIGDILKGLYPV